MAVTLPDTDDLDVFSHEATDLYSETQKAQAIQQAADLFFLATGIVEDPEDAAVARILEWGLLDMAWKLLVGTENKTESFSPYTSERIGSYSYSKSMSKAMVSLNQGELTGVEWFDAAVKLLQAEAGDNAVFLATENVFARPYKEDHPSLGIPGFPDFFGR